MTCSRGYWQCVWARSRPGVDVVTVRTEEQAASICRNAGRRGYIVWRKRNTAGHWSLSVVGSRSRR